MLVLRLNGRALTLLPNTQLSYEVKSGIFEEESLVGAYSFSFTLPLDDNNREHFGFPEVVENMASLLRVYPGCELEDAGQVVGRGGELRLRSILPKTVRATVSFGLSAFVAQLSRPLASFELGGVLTMPERVTYNGNQLPGLVAHANTVMKSPDSFPYLFAPVMNEWTGETDRPYLSAFNKWLWHHEQVGAVEALGAFSWDVPFTPAGETAPINPPLEMGPLVRLPYLLGQIFQELGVLARRVDLPGELGQLVLLHTVNMGGSFRLAWVLPTLSVADLLRRLRASLGLVVTIGPDGQASIDLVETLLSRPDFVDWTDKAAPLMDEREVGEPTGALLSYVVAGGDEIGETFFAAPDDLPMLGSVPTVAGLPAGYDPVYNAGDQLYLVGSENRYYRSRVRNNLADGSLLVEWEPSGSTRVPVATTYAPGVTLEKYEQGHAATATKTYAENQRYPGSTMDALYPAFVKDETEPNDQLRLAFYRGMQPYKLDAFHPYAHLEPKYPLVTPFHQLADGTTLGEYSLQLDGPAGTYQKLLRRWLALRQLTPVKRDFYLSAADLASLDVTRKILVDGVLYLLVSVKLTLPITKPASCLLVPQLTR